MIRIAFLALAAGMLQFVGGQASAETLRIAHHHAVDSLVDKAANKFAELVEEKTNGELTVSVFPAAQLGQELEAFEQLNQGVLDATVTSIGLMDKYWTPVQITSLPFLWRNWDHAENAINGEFMQVLNQGVLDNSNARLIGTLGFGFRDMIFREDPVTSVDGMQGLKMRSPESLVWIRMFELLGAKPTPVTWGEVYTAMQTGVAAGLEAPAFNAMDMRFDEVTSAIVKTQHMFAAMAIAVNKNRYDSLAPELQKAVSEAGAEAGQWITKIARDGAEEAYEQWIAKGNELLEPEDPAAWAAKVKPLWDEIGAKHPESAKLIQLLDETK